MLTDPAGADAAPRRYGVPLAGRRATPRGARPAGRAACTATRRPALRMIGVTGTQGKTTTTRLAEGGLQRAGVPAAVVGTVGTRVAGADLRTALTTPEAPDLHGLFAMMRERHVAACAMEVSSHALVMGRVDGVVFDVAVFTNLGRDHLDFHADVEDYFAAKASLFTPERARLGLVNVDDEHGRRLVEEATIPVRTFSLTGRDADWQAVDVELEAAGSRFTVLGPDGLAVDAGVPLPGDFNVANALAAVAACAEAGFDAGRVADGIARGAGRPGPLRAGGRRPGLRRRRRLRPQARRRRGRAAHAAAAHRRPGARGASAPAATATPASDRSWARSRPGWPTSWSSPTTTRAPRTPPRSGPPCSPAPPAPGPRCSRSATAGRRSARRCAGPRPGDIVLVAGKGHETGQEVAGVVHPFDDRRRRCARSWPADDPDDPGRDRRRRRRHASTATRPPGSTGAGVRRQPGRRARRAVRGRRRGARRRPRLRRRAPHAGGAAAVLGTRRTGVPAVLVDDPVAALGRLARHVLDTLDVDRAGADRLAGQDRHQGLPRRRCSPPPGRPSPRPATTTTSSGCRSPCCAPTADTAYLVRRDGRPRRRATSPTCARSRRRAVAAVINVGTAHLGEFGSREAIAQAKGEIVEALPGRRHRGAQRRRRPDRRDGRPGPTARVLTFGARAATSPGAASSSTTSAARRSSSGTPARGTRCALTQSGAAPGANAAAAAAMALAVGLPLAEVADGAQRRAAAPRRWRMELHERADGLVVVNDAYNANPASMVAAIDALVAIGGRRGPAYRRRAGRDAGARRRRRRRRTARSAAPAAAAGRRRASSPWASRPGGSPRAPTRVRPAGRVMAGPPRRGVTEALAWVRENVAAEDVVLVKASRGAALAKSSPTDCSRRKDQR